MKQERVRADQVEHSKAEPEQHNGECYTGCDDVGHDLANADTHAAIDQVPAEQLANLNQYVKDMEQHIVRQNEPQGSRAVMNLLNGFRQQKTLL